MAVLNIVGIILIIVVAVILTFVLYTAITKMQSSQLVDNSYLLSFSQDKSEGSLLVITCGTSIKWSDLKIEPDTVLINDIDGDGYIDGGEYLYNCTGKEVTIVYKPSNLLLGTWDFT